MNFLLRIIPSKEWERTRGKENIHRPQREYRTHDFLCFLYRLSYEKRREQVVADCDGNSDNTNVSGTKNIVSLSLMMDHRINSAVYVKC